MSSLLKHSTSSTKADQSLRFVSIGECMVEMAPTINADEYKLGFAGDTFNTAWYAKALFPSCQSRFVSRVGTDDASDKMLDMMAHAGIDTEHMLRSPDRSVGLYLISLNNGERSFSYWRDSSAARQLADDAAALKAATDDSDVIYFSGITMAILDAKGRETLLDTVAKARADGKTTVFDSNLRPRLWDSPKTMCDTVMRASAVSDIVLPSYDDEADHFGDANITATRDRYLATGATTVIVKNGEGDVHFTHGEQSGHVSPPVATAVVDTTSAGDSFNAGFLVSLHQTGSVRGAILKAAQVAGHVISQKGALVPLPADFIGT
ncbi:2-keto-3-deoxygluconate kinase [Octadecabacter temperatus]|uniref:2-dehydro-3-deoxygluconokinase n=1 Tax=Octadecabacter temperatus TaxID=1458307 RepID=A0A0K0Y718_9RHOB|nr:sugar kinase [Octadecabacter temperatus]AKS46667.1 2-dehydro-3-deoxygluconokinase [Octadecabacter temperatus]SIO18922.1 2-keto-3-deoxygluconate kinase [Octadecabacter temperatus]